MTPTTTIASCATAVLDCQDTASTDTTVWFVVLAALVGAGLAAVTVAIVRRARRRPSA